MIEGNQYIETVKRYFQFLIDEFNFRLTDEKIRGNAFYDVQYRDQTKVVSISYENIEDYFLVTIFLLEHGRLPDYDNKMKTLHLNKLNEIILSKASKNEIDLNNEYFARYVSKDEVGRRLLKSAKELRLCLNHFNELKTA